MIRKNENEQLNLNEIPLRLIGREMNQRRYGMIGGNISNVDVIEI